MAIPYATEDQLNQLESKLSKKIETIEGGGTTLDIPSKTSDLENDSGFITSEALSSYYTKTETDALIAGIETGGSTTIDAYTKAETDSLLADKADISSLTALSSEVSTLSSSLGTLETVVEGKADTSALADYVTADTLSTYATASDVSGIYSTLLANFDNYVSLTGDQTINGSKTFTSNISAPTATFSTITINVDNKGIGFGRLGSYPYANHFWVCRSTDTGYYYDFFHFGSGTGSSTRRTILDEVNHSEFINELPDLPEDAESKTYVLKAINGTLTWVEE